MLYEVITLADHKSITGTGISRLNQDIKAVQQWCNDGVGALVITSYSIHYTKLYELLDYGVAKELKEKDISSTMVGSRPFMAPEQIMGESQIASDVWALGVVMYAIYTEYLPFYHDNEKVLMDLILTIEPNPPRKLEPDIPVELEEIMLKCLKKDPKESYNFV